MIGIKQLQNAKKYSFTIEGIPVEIKDNSNAIPLEYYYYHRDTNKVWDSNQKLIGYGKIVKKLFLSKAISKFI